MALRQDKFDPAEGWDAAPRGFSRSYSRIAPSERADERHRLMLDGSDLSLSERLRYALGLLSPTERDARIDRSPKQLRRYLDGADPPLSVLVQISVATGVPTGWLADGRADISFGVPDDGMTSPDGASAPETLALPNAEGAGGALPDDFGVRRQISEEQPHRGLAWTVNPDRIARAYQMAMRGIVTRPGWRPDPRRIMQVTLLIYDELTDAEEATEREAESP